MPIAGLSYVTLTGTFVNLHTAAPSVGQLRFSMPFQMVNTTTNEIVIPADFSAVLDGNGQFSLSLPCTDDPDFEPTDRYWSVTEVVDGRSRTYAILLPASPSAQDLADIAPIEPTDPAAVYVLANSAAINVLPSGDTSGATDTAAIHALQEAGTNATLGTGTYWSDGTLTKKTGSWWIGQGVGNTVIKLAAGANSDVIKGFGFDALTGTVTQGGITNCGIAMMTIDGNKANQTGAIPFLTGSSLGNPFNLPASSATSFTVTLNSSAGLAPTGRFTLATLSGVAIVNWSANNTGTNVLTCSCIGGNGGRVNSNVSSTPIYTYGCGIRWYAYDADLHFLEIRNCAEDGIWSEWGQGNIGFGDEMESRASNLKAHDSGRNGVTWLGSHDSFLSNSAFYRNAWTNVLLAGAATVNASYVHTWGAPSRFGFDVHSGATFTGCTAEVTSTAGSRGMRILCGNAANVGGVGWHGGIMFASTPGSGGLIGIEVGNNSGKCYVFTQIVGCTNGAIQFDSAGDAGNSSYELLVNQSSGPAICGVTPGAFSLANVNASTRLKLMVTGGSTTANIDTDRWVRKASAAVTPSASANTYGTTSTLLPTHQAPSLPLSHLSFVSGGTFGSETVTAQVTATFTDGTSASFTTTFTASGVTYTLTGTDKYGLVLDGASVASLAFATKSTIGSSAATVTYQYASGT